MADASTFGGGLDFDTIAGTVPGGAVPASAGAADGGGEGADAPPAPVAGPAAPAIRPAATASPFGSGLVINPPAPDATPLDAAENLLRQRVERATAATSGVKGVVLGILNPEARMHNMQLVQQGAQQLAEIQRQKATLAQNQQEAANLGLAPGEVSEYATREARVQAAQAGALKGDLRKFQGLMTVDPKAADAIADQVHEAVAGHLTNAQFAYDKLSNMTTQGEYAAGVQDLRNKGVLKDIEALGFKVPDTLDAFNASKAGEGLALRNARINLDGLKNKLEARNTYQPMEKKEAESWNGRIQTAGGDLVSNGVWGRNAASGTPGFIVNGMADPRKLGDGFVLGNNDQRKQLTEEFKSTVPKEALEKFREFNRTYKLATDGQKDGKINTNPNVQQGVAEGLAAMLRGGNGGANVGLLKIELAKRGWAQGAIDGLVSNYSGAMNTLFANANKPYLSETTQRQIRDVMDVLKIANDEAITDHGGDRIAYRAGALGFDSTALGLGKGEFGAGVDDAIAKGRQDQIDRMMQSHQAIGGGDGVLQVGAQRPGAGAVQSPAGTSPSNQLPGAQPVATPVQQAAGARTPPSSPSPSGPSPASPNQPQARPPEGGGGDGPGPQQPDPVHVQLQGVSGAVQQWLTDKGIPPGPGMQKQIDAVLTNPRIEKAMESGKPIDGKTVAAALGKGGDKEAVSKLTEFLNAQPNTDAETFSDENKKSMTENAAAAAPAVGGTLGAVGGSIAGGPVGGAVGGAAGGAMGQMAQSYLRGEDQDPKAIAKEAALSGVLGVMSEARPIAALAARTLGAGGVEAGAAALEGKDGADVAEAGMKGTGAAVLGEAFGRALGMTLHKAWNWLSGDGRQALQKAAGEYAEATRTLETTEPKIAGADGAMVDNPKYATAEQAKEKAEKAITDIMPNAKPDEVAYAYDVSKDAGTKQAVPTGEALVKRPGDLAQKEFDRQYGGMRDDVQQAGVGTPKASAKLADGPSAVAEQRGMDKTVSRVASDMEMRITAPAKDWGDKWQQLQDVRSDLLKKERDALGSTSPHKSTIAEDYRALADSVRAQQKKVAEYVFGKEHGAAFIENLERTDKAYAIYQKATNGGDIERAAKMTGEKGREARKAFVDFAGDDKAAIDAFDLMRKHAGADKQSEKNVELGVIAEGGGWIKKAVSIVQLRQKFREWQESRYLNGHADFATMVGIVNPDTKLGRNVGGAAATNVGVRASQ